MRSNMFWGVFFVVLGILMLVNYVFGLHLPAFRILFAVFIIYMGVKMLFGSFGFEAKKITSDYQAVFSKSKFSYPSQDRNEESKNSENDYQTVFGNAELDLTNVDLSKGPEKIKIDSVFGKTTLLLKKETPFKIESSVVFGQISLPNKQMSSIGDWSYQSENFSKETNGLSIQADVVFGQLIIELKD